MFRPILWFCIHYLIKKKTFEFKLKNNYLGLLILFILAIIWGSSFILIKEGLKYYDPIQLAALRILISGIVVLPLAIGKLKYIKRPDYKYLFLAGLIGSAIPAFLFALAQTRISSSLTGALNSLTPIFTLLIAAGLIGIKFSKGKILGVMLGLVGALLLILSKSSSSIEGDYLYALLVVLATVMYGSNVNLIKQKFQDYPTILVTAFPLVFVSGIGLGTLIYTGFELDVNHQQALRSFGSIAILAIFGTALALLLFNRLLKMTDAVFASTVTYLIPVVALFWGWCDGEEIGLLQNVGLIVIMVSIALTRKKD